MKGLSKLTALSIATGVCCGTWAYVSGLAGLSGWLGFVTCTTYFACDKKGIQGVVKALALNYAGMLCALVILVLNDRFPFEGSLMFYAGIVNFIMCMISRLSILSYIPGIFLGCCATFGANGDVKAIVLAFLCGSVVGIASDKGGEWLFQKLHGEKEEAGVS